MITRAAGIADHTSIADGESDLREGGPWNVSCAPSMLRYLKLETILDGLRKGYVYIGLLGTVFCWHWEDSGMLSLNFLRSGSSKVWFTVHQHDTGKFIEFLRKFDPKAFEKCPNAAQHKVYYITPWVLMANGIRVNVVSVARAPCCIYVLHICITITRS